MWGDCAARYMAAAAASGRSTHGFNLLPTIIKAGDDLIQEAFALQVRCPTTHSRVMCLNPGAAVGVVVRARLG
jgi:hypothetical protein